jgi:23S rRNA C2498 (ribose-2'-O)-methylase RlmM
MPSDIRLKENVMKVGDVQPGVGWYTWTWNDTAKAMGVDAPTEGVMAQELIEVDPSAVLIGEDGYYRVDYSKVDRGQKQA